MLHDLREGRLQTPRRVPIPAAAPCPRLQKSGKAHPAPIPSSARLETPTPSGCVPPRR